MRWLLVSSQHHPTQGGIGAYVARFAQAALAAGWPVELITRPGNLHPRGMTIHAVSTRDMEAEFQHRVLPLRRIERIRPYRFALWSLAVAERLRELDGCFDAVEFVDSQAEGFASIGNPSIRARFRAMNAPMVIHAHTPMFVEEHVNGADLQRFGRELYHDWERRALQRSDGVITTSAGLANRLADPCPVQIIPYPIAEEPMRQQLYPGQRENLILLIGSVQPRKGVDLWARSLNRVFAAHSDVRAALIGPDTPTAPDGLSMAAHVQRLIWPRFLDRFRWVGSLPNDEVRRLIHRAALVVVPSTFESFSFVAAEALVIGTPVIVSENVGISEHVPSILKHPSNSVEALAAAQLDVLANPERAFANARACRDELLKTCSPERHLQMRAGFIDSLRWRSTIRSLPEERDNWTEELRRFIAGVEEAERASDLVSSEMS